MGVVAGTITALSAADALVPGGFLAVIAKLSSGDRQGATAERHAGQTNENIEGTTQEGMQ